MSMRKKAFGNQKADHAHLVFFRNGFSSCAWRANRRVFLFRVRQIPERPAAADGGTRLEIMRRRRRGGGPLQRPRIPGIIAGRLPAAQAREMFHSKTSTAKPRINAPMVEMRLSTPSPADRDMLNAPRHAHQTQKMLHEEGQC